MESLDCKNEIGQWKFRWLYKFDQESIDFIGMFTLKVIDQIFYDFNPYIFLYQPFINHKRNANKGKSITNIWHKYKLRIYQYWFIAIDRNGTGKKIF